MEQIKEGAKLMGQGINQKAKEAKVWVDGKAKEADNWAKEK